MEKIMKINLVIFKFITFGWKNLMRAKAILSLLTAAGLLLHSTGINAQRSGAVTEINDKNLKFDKVKFIAKINESKLGSGVLDGYAAVIIKNGVIVAETAGGPAVRDDGADMKFAAMTTSTPNDIGSSFKLISFITLLSIFEKRAAKNPAYTIEKQLNEPIFAYLPKAWRDCVKAGNALSSPCGIITGWEDRARIAKITFAQLMSHKSGFRTLPSNANDPFDYIKAGIKAENVGVRSYANMNAAILTYLWPRLVDPAKADQLDASLFISDHLSSYHASYGKAYGDFFEGWMQSNVFNVIQPKIQPSCDPAVDFPKRNPPVTFARYYKYPLGGNNSQYWSEKHHNHGCHAQGGYYLGMRQLAAFMANYQATNTLISNSVREMMYDDSTEATRDARLGWSRTIVSPFATKYFKVNEIPIHGGDGFGHSAIVQLPGGFIAVGTMNGAGSSTKVATDLKDAWGEALRANFE
jgi:hypothetical protein